MKNSQESKPVRQNETYTKSRKHEANLRRNPTLHFQIGLVLSLLVAILFIEMRMPATAQRESSLDLGTEDVLWNQNFDIERPIEKIEKPVVKERSQSQPSNQFEEVPDETELIEEFLPPSEPNPEAPIDPVEAPGYVDVDDEPVNVDWIKIEQVPLFPGCEGLTTNDERKACMSSKINKLVSRKFNTEIGEELGLTGLNRIFVQFTIDSNGDVTNVKSRGPHDQLEAEAERVVNLIPKMTPGKQRNVPVGVIYNLPITFRIQD